MSKHTNTKNNAPKQEQKKQPDEIAVVQSDAHLVITEKDTGRVIVNQRG